MDETKLFKNIWRFNVVVIAAAGVLAVIVLIFSVYMVYSDTVRNRHRNEIVNIDPETNIEEIFRLGIIEHVKGSLSVIVPLYSDQNFSLSYSGGKSTASTRNLLFSDMRKESNKWLLPSNDFLIVKHRLINTSNSYDRNKDIITIFYQVVKDDTNNDSRLTRNDKIIIAFSDPEGNNYSEVIKNVDDVLGYDVLDENTIAIMFNRESQGYIAYIELSGFAVTKEIALSKIN